MSGQSTVEDGSGPEANAVEPLPLRPVLTLTEEELLVLTDGDLGVVPGRIAIDDVAADHELVRTVATRTLMARGLITPVAGPEGPDPTPAPAATTDAWTSDAAPVAWEATEPLGLALGLRALAPTVLALSRALAPLTGDPAVGQDPAPTHDWRYLHLHPEVAVIEDVTEAGMHGLLTVFPDRYGDALRDFILPPDVVAGGGPPRTLTGVIDPPSGGGAEDPSDGSVMNLLADLGHPAVIIEAQVARRGQSGHAESSEGCEPEYDGLMVALGQGGSFWSRDSRTYHPVDPQEVIDGILTWALTGCSPR